MRRWNDRTRRRTLRVQLPGGRRVDVRAAARNRLGLRLRLGLRPCTHRLGQSLQVQLDRRPRAVGHRSHADLRRRPSTLLRLLPRPGWEQLYRQLPPRKALQSGELMAMTAGSPVRVALYCVLSSRGLLRPDPLSAERPRNPRCAAIVQHDRATPGNQSRSAGSRALEQLQGGRSSALRGRQRP